MDGSGKDSDIPRRVFAMLHNCFEVEHALSLMMLLAVFDE